MIRKMHKELWKVLAMLCVLTGVLAMIEHAFIKKTPDYNLKMVAFHCVQLYQNFKSFKEYIVQFRNFVAVLKKFCTMISIFAIM